jgi:hypothetical protein
MAGITHRRRRARRRTGRRVPLPSSSPGTSAFPATRRPACPTRGSRRRESGNASSYGKPAVPRCVSGQAVCDLNAPRRSAGGSARLHHCRIAGRTGGRRRAPPSARPRRRADRGRTGLPHPSPRVCGGGRQRAPRRADGHRTSLPAAPGAHVHPLREEPMIIAVSPATVWPGARSSRSTRSATSCSRACRPGRRDAGVTTTRPRCGATARRPASRTSPFPRRSRRPPPWRRASRSPSPTRPTT